MRSRLGALALLLAIGCADPAGVQPEPIGEPYVLAPGAIAWHEATRLLVGFEGVVSDSRCPEDVQCVTAGDAVLELWLRRPPEDRVAFALHTDAAAGGAFEYAGYRVRLIGLDPVPRSDRAIAPGDYRATLVVEP